MAVHVFEDSSRHTKTARQADRLEEERDVFINVDMHFCVNILYMILKLRLISISITISYGFC